MHHLYERSQKYPMVDFESKKLWNFLWKGERLRGNMGAHFSADLVQLHPFNAL